VGDPGLRRLTRIPRGRPPPGEAAFRCGVSGGGARRVRVH
jgi:hypothetical protein